MVNKKDIRKKKKIRIRKKIFGTSDKPRLCVFRSDIHTYAQLIDDSKGVTLIATSTLNNNIIFEENSNKTQKANTIGKRIAQLAIEKGIKQVVFDRNGYLYHGRIKAISEGAREAGLIF